MDRPRAVAALLAAADEAVAALETQLAEAQRHAAAAPSAMESHSDTTRNQLHVAIANLRETIEAKRRFRAVLENSLPSPDGAVATGSLVTVTGGKGEPFAYLILESGGTETTVGSLRVMAIARTTPLAQALMGRRTGETVTVRDKLIEVTAVE